MDVNLNPDKGGSTEIKGREESKEDTEMYQQNEESDLIEAVREEVQFQL